jgi:hypothetical protein
MVLGPPGSIALVRAAGRVKPNRERTRRKSKKEKSIMDFKSLSPAIRSCFF